MIETKVHFGQRKKQKEGIWQEAIDEDIIGINFAEMGATILEQYVQLKCDDIRNNKNSSIQATSMTENEHQGQQHITLVKEWRWRQEQLVHNNGHHRSLQTPWLPCSFLQIFVFLLPCLQNVMFTVRLLVEPGSTPNLSHQTFRLPNQSLDSNLY